MTENVDYKLSYTGDTTNVGTVKITIKGKGNYNGSTEVSYKITERSVTLTSATDSKVYEVRQVLVKVIMNLLTH